MDVTLKEPANIAASGPSGHTAWQNIYVFASTGLHCCGALGQYSAGYAAHSSILNK